MRDLAPERSRHADVNRRLLAIVLITLLAAGGLIFRLVQLQIVDPERYVAQGLAQRTRVIDLPGTRGDILDRNGNRLATSIPQNTFFIDPEYVVDPVGAAEALAPILGQTRERLLEKFTAEGRFVYLARQVSDETSHLIDALELDGVFSLEEPRRFNPAGDDFAASFLGRVGVDSQPLSGLEYAYDEVLGGVPGEMVVEKNPAGQTIPMGPRELQPAQPGSDLILTIDRSLQYEVERLLTAQVTSMVAKGGVAVVTDTRSGDILAMVSVTRDAGRNVVLSSDNQAATWAFEPGSVMKAITFASVLDAGLADPSTVQTVPWTYQLYDREFTDVYQHEPTDWTVSDIVTQSSNVGSIMWATELGATRFDSYLREFGLTETVLGLPGETAGLLLDIDDWDGTMIGAVPLGQSISVSALQMLQAYNVIANDGQAVPLRLVQGTVTPDGESIPFAVEEPRSVISAETAGEMRSILRNVVVAGTGTAASVEGYEVAGKTGTARKPLPTGGYRDADGNFHYVASFVGFLPANDPEISILVAIDEPAASIYASAVAAPVFADIAHYSLRHFNIAPSATVLEVAPLTSDEAVVAEDGILASNPAPLVALDAVLDESAESHDSVAADPSTASSTAPAPGPVAPTVTIETVDPIDPVDPVDADGASDTEPSAELPVAEATADSEPAAIEPAAVNPTTPSAEPASATASPSTDAGAVPAAAIDTSVTNDVSHLFEPVDLAGEPVSDGSDG